MLDIEPEWVHIHLRLAAIHSKKTWKEIQLKLLRERELKEQAILKRYFKSVPENYQLVKNVYRFIENETNGDSIKYGSEVSLDYKGSFLNGYVFDNTNIKGVTPTFTFGKEYQMIEGLQLGLVGLKEGQTVKIILPSQLAFGEEGSLSGIVPPFTAVKFEINIIKVIN